MVVVSQIKEEQFNFDRGMKGFPLLDFTKKMGGKILSIFFQK